MNEMIEGVLMVVGTLLLPWLIGVPVAAVFWRYVQKPALERDHEAGLRSDRESHEERMRVMNEEHRARMRVMNEEHRARMRAIDAEYAEDIRSIREDGIDRKTGRRTPSDAELRALLNPDRVIGPDIMERAPWEPERPPWHIPSMFDHLDRLDERKRR